MKPTSTIILIALCVVVALCGQLSNAQTTTKPNSHQYSGEAKQRKTTAPDLVAPKKPASKKYDGDCEFTDALYNISSTKLSPSQQVTFNQFIQYEIIDNILLNVQLTEIEMVVECSYALKHFLEVNVDISVIIEFEEIGVWGCLRDFKQVAVDLQADVAQTTVTLDSNDDCELFDAMLNATSGNATMQSAVIELIAELKIVLKDKTLTHGQIMAKLHEHFKLFFDMYPGWKSFFYSIQINGFGSLESLDDVCHQYDRSLTVSKVVSGSSDSDCVLLGKLTNASADTTYTISVRSQLKQFHDVIAAYFATTTDIALRLHYVVSQYYQMEIVEGFIISIIDVLELDDAASGEEWGDFYDLLSCDEFCYNQGDCGNLDDGLGTSPAPSTTVPPPTTIASTTMAPANCGSRSNLIVVTAQNTTILTDVLTTNYNSWNSSMRLSFNTCFNQIRTAIWNNVAFPTSSSKITEIVADFNTYAKNQPNLKSVVFSIFFSSWQGTVTQFCNCGSG